MPSGGLATIDLAQSAEAVELARQLLREEGAVLVDEEAPGAGGHQPEGENQKSAEHPIASTLLPAGADAIVARWITDYMLKRAELLESMGRDAVCVKWAEQLANNCDRSMMSSLLEKVNASGMLPPFPDAGLPFWAVEAEVEGPVGGEAVVRFLGREHRAGEFWARLEWGMYVVTKTTHTEPFGSLTLWDSPIVLVHSCTDDIEISTPEDAQDLARALSSAAAELAEIRRTLGDAFITDGVSEQPRRGVL